VRRFTGARWDPSSATYYLRARTYSPHLALFTSRDPLGYVDSYDVWMYVGGNPFAFVDPWGMGAEEDVSHTSRGERRPAVTIVWRPLEDHGIGNHVFLELWPEDESILEKRTYGTAEQDGAPPNMATVGVQPFYAHDGEVDARFRWNEGSDMVHGVNGVEEHLAVSISTDDETIEMMIELSEQFNEARVEYNYFGLGNKSVNCFGGAQWLLTTAGLDSLLLDVLDATIFYESGGEFNVFPRTEVVGWELNFPSALDAIE
jgi:RHS repeat-associated protein